MKRMLNLLSLVVILAGAAHLSTPAQAQESEQTLQACCGNCCGDRCGTNADGSCWACTSRSC